MVFAATTLATISSRCFNEPACRQGRLDVAEHLLRALEVLGETDESKRREMATVPLTTRIALLRVFAGALNTLVFGMLRAGGGSVVQSLWQSRKFPEIVSEK